MDDPKEPEISLWSHRGPGIIPVPKNQFGKSQESWSFR
jgi:hypothetical protein